MAEQHAAFVGNVPLNYDRYLGPLLFHAYADEVAARLPVRPGLRVLELASGTGILTERLLRRLGGQGTLVATDLNEAMMAHAKARGVAGPGLTWRQADGASLPFPDGAFDVVVCQFGLMFFPDQAAGVREARRVLAPGGTYLLSVWDRLERNVVTRIGHDTITSFFPADPPQFYRVPFNLHDAEAVRQLLDAAGFAEVAHATVAKVGESPSAAEAAIGLVEGNPVIGTIMERRPEALRDIEAAVARGIAAELGDHPVRSPLSAHIFTAKVAARP
jgi:ubiquinone/menaquinone biosynthesis C-methylase UbiE